MQRIHSALPWVMPWIVALLVLTIQIRITPAQPTSASVSFDAPGSNDTEATAISGSGEIVGRFFTSDGVRHAFRISGGHFLKIDYPGSTSSEANWISPGGIIGGDYIDTAGHGHGFVLENGRYTDNRLPRFHLLGGLRHPHRWRAHRHLGYPAK